MYFPHEGNNFRAKLLHPSGFFLIKVALVGLQIVMQFMIVSPFPKIMGYAANISVDEVVRLTNVKRAENGLPPLTINDTLSKTAKAKGEHMLANGYWAHVAPDGTEPWAFFRDGGYKYRFAGENLARDFSDANSAVEAWMASPSHRENILSDRYRDIGIGVVEGDLDGVDTTIIVQFMGTRFADTLPADSIASGASSEESTPQALTSTPSAEVAGTAQAREPQVLISPFVTTKGVSIAIVAVLMVLLVVDALVISKRRIRRAGGRVFAHLAFLGMIATIILILKAGKVL